MLAEKQHVRYCRSAAGFFIVTYDPFVKFAACAVAVKASQKMLCCNVNLGA
jgi:hypothetical protein